MQGIGDQKISIWNDADLRHGESNDPGVLGLFHKIYIVTSELNISFLNNVLNLSVRNPMFVLILVRDSFNDRCVNSLFCWMQNGEIMFPGSSVWTSKSQIHWKHFSFQHVMDSNLDPVITLPGRSNRNESVWYSICVQSSILVERSISTRIRKNLAGIRIWPIARFD
jgi:hypothetical protein